MHLSPSLCALCFRQVGLKSESLSYYINLNCHCTLVEIESYLFDRKSKSYLVFIYFLIWNLYFFKTKSWSLILILIYKSVIYIQYKNTNSLLKCDILIIIISAARKNIINKVLYLFLTFMAQKHRLSRI